MYSVPLDKLYKILASCQFRQDAEFCPVLIQIMDEQIRKIRDKFEYLLQVWTDEGELVYERTLHKPISNWNISGNKLVFQEDKDSEDIYLVKLFKKQ